LESAPAFGARVPVGTRVPVGASLASMNERLKKRTYKTAHSIERAVIMSSTLVGARVPVRGEVGEHENAGGWRRGWRARPRLRRGDDSLASMNER
jgi:hypothetical protein